MRNGHGSGEAFEKTEEASLFVMDVDMVAVEYRRHSTHNISVPARKKVCRLRVSEKRIFVAQYEFHLT